MSVMEIQKSAATLSDKERGKLAAWLLDSLPPSSDEDASSDSIVEADRRRAELDSGKVQPLSNEEFWDSIAREYYHEISPQLEQDFNDELRKIIAKAARGPTPLPLGRSRLSP